MWSKQAPCLSRIRQMSRRWQCIAHCKGALQWLLALYSLGKIKLLNLRLVMPKSLVDISTLGDNKLNHQRVFALYCILTITESTKVVMSSMKICWEAIKAIRAMSMWKREKNTYRRILLSGVTQYELVQPLENSLRISSNLSARPHPAQHFAV